jgi:chloramphenicol-sensitive protein RarD
MNGNSARNGLFLGLGTYAFWGVLPLYFWLLGGVPALEVLAHRVVWSLLLLVIVITLLRRWRDIRAAATMRTVALLAASATLIAVNWLVYIWSVSNHQTLAASLGYFINPLVNVALGVAVLGERLRRWQGVAIAIASVGVVAMALGAVDTLWISLTLAVTFGIYGLVRKVVAIDSLGGLLIETALLAPPSLIYLLVIARRGGGAFGHDPVLNAKLVLLGLVTAAPLLMFAAAARRLPYSSMALLQYVAPTLQFIVAVTVFGEALRPLHFLVFGLIWAGCAVFAWDSVRAARGRA